MIIITKLTPSKPVLKGLPELKIVSSQGRCPFRTDSFTGNWILAQIKCPSLQVLKSQCDFTAKLSAFQSIT